VFEIQFIDFIYPGFNQLVSNLANIRWRTNGDWKVPAVFYAPYGAYLPGGGLWHSQANEAVFAHFPGLNVVVPSTPEDAAGLFWTAMHADDMVLILLPKHLLWAEKIVADPIYSVPLGKARRCREGEDVTVIAWGNAIEKSQEAIMELKDDASVELIDLRSIAPWDRELIEASVRKTGRLIVVQEDTENCSVGQMIITHVLGCPELWAALKAPPVLVSKGNVMIGYNPIYEYAALPDMPRILEAIRRTVAIDRARGEIGQAAVASPEVGRNNGSPTNGVHHPSIPAVDFREFIVTVPIMGEGLRTGRVVSLNKQSGEAVKHDDVLCEVETDKAVYPIEASFAGRFKEWKIKLDDMVLIGQEIALIVRDPAPAVYSSSQILHERPAVAVAKNAAQGPAISSSAISTHSGPMKGTVRPPALTPAITKRLATVIPATMLRDVRWDALRAAREEAKKKHGNAAASPSAMMAWCVVRAQEKHAAFRSLVHKDGTIFEQGDFDFGVAVALEGDRLATAPIPAANTLGWTDFVAAYNHAVEETRSGKLTDVQAPVNITSLGAFGIESAMPIVVPPSMATLFVGSAHERLYNDNGVVRPVEVITLSLTFDHKVVNGGGAAAFLYEIKDQMEAFKLPG
jgi:2-oxoisovalerate dehydrogenase E1 component